eukprot:2754499-Prymnesium_polylepis.3
MWVARTHACGRALSLANLPRELHFLVGFTSHTRCMTADPRAVLAPAWCMTSAWDPRSRRRASRTRAMFVCRVLVAR